MNSDFELILEECLAQIRAGKTLDECLAAHPAQAKKLRPLLQAATQVWKIPVPRARQEAVQAGRERLLASANRLYPSSQAVSSGQFARYTRRVLGAVQVILFGKQRSSLALAYRMAAIIALALLVMAGITVKVSARSLPGDRLYNVKRSWENVRLSLSPSQQRRLKLEEQFAAERREEIQELIQLRRAETVEFEAPLQALDADYWQIDGFQVHIAPDTDVQGNPEMGLDLYVRARLQKDGTLTAIQVRSPILKLPSPTPTGMPGAEITPELDENPAAEAPETPQNLHEPGKTAEPTEVKPVEKGDETAHPTQEPEQDDTQVPAPHWTRTPEPTEQHEKGNTPEPTEEHEDEGISEPTETRKPIHTPEATEQPHETPEPTDES